MRQDTAHNIAGKGIQKTPPTDWGGYLEICSETGLFKYSHRSIYKIMGQR